MFKEDFKIGDKVKLPKTKSIGRAVDSSTAIRKARSLRQDFLYINDIDFGKYTLGERRSNGGDFFAVSDVEKYDEKPKVRISDTIYFKSIVANPCVIYILKDLELNKHFRGVAKVMEGDVFDEITGLQIAKLKAEIKQNEYKLKQYLK